MEFQIKQLHVYVLCYQGGKDKSADQTVGMPRLICILAICIWHKQVLSYDALLFSG